MPYTKTNGVTKLKRKRRPRNPVPTKKRITFVDGEKRGLDAPYGATKAEANENQRKRDIRNYLIETRAKFKALDARVVVVELDEADMDFVDNMVGVSSIIGDCRESVMRFLVTLGRVMGQRW